ncbi:protein Star-like [Procambarus clarkii]|uniref:protein Star-like n=1 Tax=Procambarus clarkii TaxID=6728 RepID=UPI003743786C
MIPLRRCHAPLQILLFSFVLFFVAIVYYITIDQQQLTALMVYVPGMRGNVVTERVLTEKTLVGVAQDDPALVNYIRHHLLHPPSRQPYNLSNPAAQHFSQLGQSSYADSEVLHGMTGGFFVEVGAVDGEFLSNTLFFERNRNWTGLLIEAFPHTYQELLQKHRKAYSVNTALAIGNVSAEIHFASTGEKGVLGQISKNSSLTYRTKALPFYSILLALNVTQIDFFSLDIEGSEMKVLRTIPWDKIKIRLMCVEINHIPEGFQTLLEFMKKQGYKFLGIRSIDAWFGGQLS